jgi:hypothetical protein
MDIHSILASEDQSGEMAVKHGSRGDFLYAGVHTPFADSQLRCQAIQQRLIDSRHYSPLLGRVPAVTRLLLAAEMISDLDVVFSHSQHRCHFGHFESD